MFCPRCGQQQTSDTMRFCSRCGFLLEGAMVLLSHGGMIPQYSASSDEKKISAGRIPVVFEFFATLAAIICFVGGPLRMLYAALFEEGAQPRLAPPVSYAS